MSRIQAKDLQRAREVLEEVGVVVNDEVKNEYRGYIASLGANIAQSGLVPSVAFYENKNSNSQQDKYKIMQALLLMLKNDKASSSTLLEYLLDRQNELDVLQVKIIYYASTLKLAMNTFKKAEVKIKS